MGFATIIVATLLLGTVSYYHAITLRKQTDYSSLVSNQAKIIETGNAKKFLLVEDSYSAIIQLKCIVWKIES